MKKIQYKKHPTITGQYFVFVNGRQEFAIYKYVGYAVHRKNVCLESFTLLRDAKAFIESEVNGGVGNDT